MKRLFAILAVLLFFGVANAQKSKCTDMEQIMKVKPTPLYEKHLQASKKFSTKAIKDAKTAANKKSAGKLVSVKELGKGYRIQKLEYSRAMLVPAAKTALREIAKRFSSKAKGSTLTFTSLTRTLEDQCKLRKVNENASRGLSTHNFGNAFDVSYVRFNDRLERNERLEKLLEKVLNEFENAGKIYVIKEKQQSCYHVTVR